MSKPGIIYRINQQAWGGAHLRAADDIQEFVDIYDTSVLIDDADDEDIIEMQGAGDPVRHSTIDNGEDPFTVIKAQQLTIRFITDSAVTMETFASGEDDRWLVHNYIDNASHGNLTLFKGFIVIDDMAEDFMCEPNIVILTATDGLGLLKEIPWTDFLEENPVGTYKISEILAMCLTKTGLDLTLKAAFNIKPSGFIDDISIPNVNNQHFFDRIYLDALSFEDEIGTCISCYEVIKRILGEEACLFQRQGFWWVMRIDEVEHPTRGLYVSTFDEAGIFIENLGEQTFEKSIGKDYPYTIFFSRERTEVIPTRPYKSVRLDYDYDYPKEIVANIDFERGDLLSTVSPTEKTYSIDNWTPLFSNTSSDDAPTTSIYIRRTFEDDYEKERYVVIEAKAGDFNFIMSEPVRVGEKDKFSLSVEFRLDGNVSGSGLYRNNNVQVRLYGDDGTFWTHQSATSISGEKKWVACTSNFRTNQKYFSIEGERANDEIEALGLYDGESAEIPTAGYLRIILGASEQDGDTNDTYYSGLSFTYKPYINGSYQKYNGAYQKVTRDGGYKAKRESSVYVSDSPRRLFKGAFLLPLEYVEFFSGAVQFFDTTNHIQISGYQLAYFRRGQIINISGTVSNNIVTRVLSVTYSIVGTVTVITLDQTLVNETEATVTIEELTFELADEFYNAAVYPSGPPSADYIHPYSEIQAYDVWNQFYYDKRIFQATLQGLNLQEIDGDNLADNAHLIHKWSITDFSPHSENKFFQLLTFDQNHRDGEWTGTLREIYDTDRLKVYTGLEFKYKS